MEAAVTSSGVPPTAIASTGDLGVVDALVTVAVTSSTSYRLVSVAASAIPPRRPPRLPNFAFPRSFVTTRGAASPGGMLCWP